MAVALSEAFSRLRQGNLLDLKRALEAAQHVGHRDLTLGEVSLPNGTVFRNFQIDTGQGARQFDAMVDKANQSPPPALVSVIAAPKTKPRKEDLLSHQIAVHFGGLERANREKKTILDSKHTLRLFVGIVGHKRVAELNGGDCRSFFDAGVFWPRNASKQSGNAGLSVREIISKAKASGGEPPAAHTLSKHRQRLSVFLNVQKRKNKSSKRFIPIVQPLRDAGFLSFVEDMKAGSHERLFPHLPNADGNGSGRHMSRQLSTYIKSRGLSDAGMGFHALRHTLATPLDRAGVGHVTIARITGHGIGGGVVPKFYIDGPRLPERVEALGKFDAGVQTSVYWSGQFASSLRAVAKSKGSGR